MNTDDAPAEDVLDELQFCAFHWEPNVRLVGNIRAVDISRACGDAIKAMSLFDIALIRTHAGWLKIYTQMMTEDNWEDMRDCMSQQLNELSKLINNPVKVPTRSPNSGEAEGIEKWLSL